MRPSREMVSAKDHDTELVGPQGVLTHDERCTERQSCKRYGASGHERWTRDPDQRPSVGLSLQPRLHGMDRGVLQLHRSTASEAAYRDALALHIMWFGLGSAGPFRCRAGHIHGDGRLAAKHRGLSDLLPVYLHVDRTVLDG